MHFYDLNHSSLRLVHVIQVANTRPEESNYSGPSMAFNSCFSPGLLAGDHEYTAVPPPVAHHQNIIARLCGFRNHFHQYVKVSTPMSGLHIALDHLRHLPWNG